MAKLQYRTTSVVYVGHILSAGRKAIPPDRVNAIRAMPKPECKKDLRRIRGMINYVREFIPNLAGDLSIFSPLLKKDVEFNWVSAHDEALTRVKDKIANAVALNSFDEELPVTIQTDASKCGLGSCLIQNKAPIAFHSRQLSETEAKYSPIELELLGIVEACRKYHYYIYGKKLSRS